MIETMYQFVHFAKAGFFTEDELEVYADKFWPYMGVSEKLSLLEAPGVTKNWIREKEGFPPLSED